MSEITDTDRINFLQKILVDEAEYTQRCILRESYTGRGYRLHETAHEGASDDVRDQIDNVMRWE